MNNIRSIVKVMNFHSLLRVDKSKKQSKKYSAMESTLVEMIENILYNRNIMIDAKSLKPDPTKPKLCIFIGSDMGFCGNINSSVKKIIEEETSESELDNMEIILIGRKLFAGVKKVPLYHCTREEFNADSDAVTKIITDGIRNLDFSSIHIVYNAFINSSQVELTNKQIFPLPDNPEKRDAFKEDFALEGEPEALLKELVALYAKYTFSIAAAESYASENINRQNVTNQSLKKIDEQEEEKMVIERRNVKEKQFAKVLDNFTHNMSR